MDVTAPQKSTPIPPERPARYPMPWPPITYVVVSVSDTDSPPGRRTRTVKLR